MGAGTGAAAAAATRAAATARRATAHGARDAATTTTTTTRSDPSQFYWEKMPSQEGNQPAPRWHHTANMFEDKMIVFGGFSGSKAYRYYNDIWLLDTKTDKWSQPPPAATSTSDEGEVSLKRPWPNCPSPRGAHTCTIIDRRLLCFGGYGGAGFSRRDFNDLWCVRHEEEDAGRNNTNGVARALSAESHLLSRPWN